MKRSLLIAALLAFCALPTASSQSNGKPMYEVYAIRYAVIPDFPVAGLVKGADPARKLDIAMAV